MVNATVAGLGTALPGAVDQHLLWDRFFHGHFTDARLARRIFDGSGVHRRHAVANPVHENLSHWSTEARMQRYAAEAPPLGHRAVAAALTDAGVLAEDIRRLTVASCTGYSTPGLDIELTTSLALRPDVHRLLVGHMGCYAALPALRSTADFVIAHREPAVLLCLELTSLHVQPPTTDPQQIVSHALFSDAAVALVLQPHDDAGDEGSDGPGSGELTGGLTGALELVDTTAFVDTTAAEYMTWEITDLGFRMSLSPRVPDVLAQHLPTVLKAFLAEHELEVRDVRAWAVHPGGPRILDVVEQTLELPPQALAASRSVLAEHGNCSSATVLLVLDELLEQGALDAGGPAVAMAFGPGLTLYLGLFTASAAPYSSRRSNDFE